MGDAPGQPADGLDPLEVPKLLLGDAQRLFGRLPLRRVPRIGDDARHDRVVETVLQRHLERAPGAVVVPEAQLGRGLAPTVRVEHPVQQCPQHLRIIGVEEILEAMTQQVFRAEPQQAAGRRRDVAHVPGRVEDQDEVRGVFDEGAVVTLAAA